MVANLHFDNRHSAEITLEKAQVNLPSLALRFKDLTRSCPRNLTRLHVSTLKGPKVFLERNGTSSHFWILRTTIMVFQFAYIVIKLRLGRSCLCDTLNLYDRAISRRHRLQAGTRRHRLRQESNVDLVHRRKILHVCKVDVVLDDLL